MSKAGAQRCPTSFQSPKWEGRRFWDFYRSAVFGSHLEILLWVCWGSSSPPYQPPANISDKKRTASSLSLGKRKKFPVFSLPTSVSNVLIHSISWMQTCQSSCSLWCGYSSITLSFTRQSLAVFPGCRKDNGHLAALIFLLHFRSSFPIK